ncbi:MAG: Clp protease N-terminal domain-containing protein [Acidimicrobiales bacterium]
MFERFTDESTRVVVLAHEEARLLNHGYLGTEHILLGLVREGHGVGATAIASLGLTLDDVRRQVKEIIGEGSSSPGRNIPFTPRAKRVLELSLSEALSLGHHDIGTEHILLGLIREGEGVACHVLVRQGVDLRQARQAVLDLLGSPEIEEVAPSYWPIGDMPSRLLAIEVLLEHIVEQLDAIEKRLPPPAE